MNKLFLAIALSSSALLAQSNPQLAVQGTWQFTIGYSGQTPWQGSVEIRSVDAVNVRWRPDEGAREFR